MEGELVDRIASTQHWELKDATFEFQTPLEFFSECPKWLAESADPKWSRKAEPKFLSKHGHM